jgi:transposase
MPADSKRKTKGRAPKVDFDALSPIQAAAAGIDVGASEHWVAVPPDRDAEPVRTFTAYTGGLHELADWLMSCGITTVAMESTGVYWVPLFEILQGRGFRVCLVNARHVKNVPGRKTDVLDCQWLQKLHSYGLLQASFRPDAEFVELRSYLRHREALTHSSSAHIQHMQKALTLMNVQLHVAISDITGTTGMNIIRDIVSGCSDPARLAEHRDRRCRATKAEIVEALRGEYRPEHLFVLRQALELYDAYQSKLAECDREIALVLARLQQAAPADLAPLQNAGRGRNKRRAKQFLPKIREILYRITAGVDLTRATGLADLTALQILAEIGTDMSRWPTAHHFVSWTTLAPSCRITGGKRYACRRPRTAHRVAQILRLAAVCAGKTQTALGAFYRRLGARIGKAKAVVATAAKLARIIYTMIKNRVPFADTGADAYERRYRHRIVRSLKRRAAELGYELIPVCATDPAQTPPSTGSLEPVAAG